MRLPTALPLITPALTMLVKMLSVNAFSVNVLPAGMFRFPSRMVVAAERVTFLVLPPEVSITRLNRLPETRAVEFVAVAADPTCSVPPAGRAVERFGKSRERAEVLACAGATVPPATLRIAVD